MPAGGLHDSPRRSPGRCSIAFPEAGYYVLRSEDPAGRELLRVLFDAAELGFGPIAAHGHADALAFILWARGSEVFVDPGTYDYFSFRRWRDGSDLDEREQDTGTCPGAREEGDGASEETGDRKFHCR